MSSLLDRSAFFLALAPPGVAVEAMPLAAFDPDACDALPADRARVHGALPARRREFLAGRLCARTALARLGFEGAAVTTGADRRPVWPEGVVGSIAHTRDWGVAVVARDRDYRGLGVDLEPARPVEERTWRKILTAAERVRVEGLPPAERGLTVRLLFSAKESAWKCRFPVDGRRFGFRDVEIDLDADAGTFAARVFGEAPPETIAGRFQADPDLIATLTVWRAGPAA